MPSGKNTPSLPATPPPEHTAQAWERAREHLEQSKVRIAGQINAYPPPIPACDTHFNYLLEQRGKISEELGRLEAARRESIGQETDGQARGGRAKGGRALRDFLDSSEFINEEAERKIRADSTDW